MIKKVDEIIFRKDLYPRIEFDPITVQKYVDDLSVLPPILVNQHNELIDGWHRWTAHIKKKVEEIEVQVIVTKSDIHLLELAIKENSKHGLQLSQDDKQKMARQLYHVEPTQAKKIELAKILSVSDRTIRDWLSRIDKDLKAERDKKILGMWMACYTQAEIADACGCSVEPVKKAVSDFPANLPENLKPATEHNDGIDEKTDKPKWEKPIYNVWKFKEKSKGSKHFGNTDPLIVDRLLYLYTKPFDVVVDPFAGGGSTIDICKKRYRKYFVSDLTPIPEREEEIRQFDITQGLPKLPQWKDVRLVYLDPPYWKQAEGKYSDLPNDLSNMGLESFTLNLIKIIRLFSKKLQPGSFIALIIQPTQWKAPDKEYTDHLMDVATKIKLPIDMRIQCPFESQQCTAQMNIWAQENKKVLVISRELIVWRV